MTAAGGSTRRAAGTALLLAGYPVATWGTVRLRRAWRSGRSEPFVAFEAGTAAVATGLLLRDRKVLAGLNAATGAAVAAAWQMRRRHRR